MILNKKDRHVVLLTHAYDYWWDHCSDVPLIDYLFYREPHSTLSGGGNESTNSGTIFIEVVWGRTR